MNKYYFFNKNTPLSNTYECGIKIDSILFSSVEQYILYSKAMLFGDYEIGKKILQEKNPKLQKKINSKIRNVNQNVWDKRKYGIAYRGVYEKFKQNCYILSTLFETYPKEIVFATPHNKVWGIGIEEKNIKNVSIAEWGENLLGKILTQVRDDLAKSQRYTYENGFL